MRKRFYLILALVLAGSAIAVGSLTFSYAAVQRAKSAAQKRGTATGPARAGRTAQTAGQRPLRAPDPNRAPQAAVDEALYSDEEFFGERASVARPYGAALDRVSQLIGRYPNDPALRLHAARLSERLGQNDRATAEMNKYVELKKRSPESLRRLAVFYHNRARYSDEVKTLRDLALFLPVADRGPIYKQAAQLVRTRALGQFKVEDFFNELVAADPSNVQPVKDLVQELVLAKRNDQALSVLAAHQARFPEDLPYFLKSRARILEAKGDRRGAEQLYLSSFDPNWPKAVTSDYFDLLRRFGRYRVVRRELQDQVRRGSTDLGVVARLFRFYAHEGNYAAAALLIEGLESRRAGSGQGTTRPASQPAAGVKAEAWTLPELQTVAAMLASIGYHDQASRYFYTLYLTGGLTAGSGTREDALYRLFKALIDAGESPTRMGAGDLSFYRDISEVDQNPGFLNGVLSLVLADVNPSSEFAAEQSNAAGYFNRALAYRIFNSFRQEYPQSARLGEMYLGTIGILSSLKEYKRIIDVGKEFQVRFPDSPAYGEVSLRIADAYVEMNNRAGERAVLAPLLDKLARKQPKGVPLIPPSNRRLRTGPIIEYVIDRIKYDAEAYSDTYDPTADNPDAQQSEEGEGEETEEQQTDEGEAVSEPQSTEGEAQPVSYSSVLERYVSSLGQEEKKTETVAFFWGEIKKHPKEEGLYERFLRWLGQSELIAEQLRAYESAIREFDSDTWYHRLARWYVRQKRGRELSRYSRQLIGIFDEDEVSDYLLRFAGYGPTSDGDKLDWDQKLAFDLYSYAHNKFPRNLFFVGGMLSYLEKNDRAAWEKLAARYYFADRAIRDPYLAWESKQSKLREMQRQARERAGTSAPATGTPALPGNFAYQIFYADSSAWLSHHDQAIEAYRRLVALYPGEPRYATRFSDLTRSFGYESDKSYEEAQSALAKMAEIYPTDHTYRIKAGEVCAEMGDFKRAGEHWEKLIELEPAERNTYLEVATVYWDYYQFDPAIRVLGKLRDVTGDPTIYAYRMGALYEGKGDLDKAIAEYVNLLAEPGEGRDTAAGRLAHLAKRPGVASRIAAQWDRARSAHQGDWQYVIGYAVYLKDRQENSAALALLSSEVRQYSDVPFLESVRELFRYLLRPEDEQLVLERLVAVARDEREVMMYRLQLASFLERHNKKDAAAGLIDKLVADFPTNAGVIDESEKFYWRAGMPDRSLDLFKRTIQVAKGSNRRALTIRMARRQSEAGRLADAEATLRAFYNENRTDAEIFRELAQTLGAAGKVAELADLYKSAVDDLRKSGLNYESTKFRIAELREGMARAYDRLGRYQDAIDQQIEVINQLPEDPDKLAIALEYAERHNLTPRLTAYYEKLSKDAYKNYRWQLVLARIYERAGNLDGAAEQYRAAVSNEPQRLEFRLMLAAVLSKPGRAEPRYDEAIAVLREAWTLSSKEPTWLIEVARIQVRQGRRDDAVQTVRQALAAKKDVSSRDLLDTAARLKTWGLSGESARLYEQGFAQLVKNIVKDYASQQDVDGYTASLIGSVGAAQAFGRLDALRQQCQAIAQNATDADRYHSQSIVGYIDSTMRSAFGRETIEHSDAAEMGRLNAAIQSATARLTTYNDRDPLLRYIGIAHAVDLPDLEEQLYVRIKDAAFKMRTKAEDGRYYSELRLLLSFYDRRAAFARSAELLTAEQTRDPFKDRFPYNTEIAARYRMAGNTAQELDWLRRAYAGASGAMTADRNEGVERYLELLYSSGSRDELSRLASSGNPYQLVLINFLIEKGEKLLAQKAIANAGMPQSWVSSRSAEVGLFSKDMTPATEEFFKQALDIKPIGEMLGRRVDSGKTLVGNDWYVAARNYGFWLNLGGRNESRRYTAAELEGRPASSRAQVELAAFYLDRKDPNRAAAHVELAAELDAGDLTVAVMRGKVEFARGNRKGATDAWGSLVDFRRTGRLSVPSAEAYLKVMAGHGLLREALPRLQEFIAAYINNSGDESQREGNVDAVKSLVRNIVAAAGKDARTTSDVAAMLYNVVNQTGEDLTIGRLVVEEDLFPAELLTTFYRSIHKRMSELAAGVAGTPEYDDGYQVGASYFYPARDLAQFRKRLADHLIRRGAIDEARLLIDGAKKDLADLAAASDEDSEGGVAQQYDWLALASAQIQLRRGQIEPAVAELRRFSGLESPDPSTPPQLDQPRCLKAYALLVAEGRQAEADTLIYDSYRAGLSSRIQQTEITALVGMAEIEVRRGQTADAAKLLAKVAERTGDDLQELGIAASTAARLGMLNEAIDYRNRIARGQPENSVNKLELARLLDAAGRKNEALEGLALVIGDRTSPNTVRAQAAESMGQIVRSSQSLAQAASVALSRSAGQGAAADLAKAAVAEASGASGPADLLAGIRGPLEPLARTRLARLIVAGGRAADAIPHLERAIYLDPDDSVSAAIAFTARGFPALPRAALALLYSRTGRDQAALRITGADGGPSGDPGLARLSAQPPQTETAVVFEPPLPEPNYAQSVKTLAELNQTAYSQSGEVIAALVESAMRLGQYDRARQLTKVQLFGARTAAEKASVDKRLSDIAAAERARQIQMASLLRVSRSNATDSIYAARALE